MTHERTSGRRRVAALTTIVVAATSLSACGKSSESGLEKILDQQSGGNVDIGDIGNIGEDGISIQTEDGSMTIDKDGNFVITDNNGESLTGQAGADDGDYNVQTDGGDFSVNTGGDIPEEWPTEIPVPEGLTDITSSATSAGGQIVISLSGQADDDFVDAYSDRLAASGFEQKTNSEASGSVVRSFEAGEYTIAVSVSPFQDANQASVTLYTTP